MKRGHCHSQLLEARVISRRKEASLRSFDLAGTIHFHNKATKVTKHRNRGSFDFFSGQAGHPVVTESAQWVGVVQPSQIFVSFVNFCSQLHTYGLGRGGLFLVVIGLLVFGPPFRCKAAVLEWETGPGYRVAKMPPLSPHKVGFTQMPGSETGVTFTNNLPESRIVMNANLLNGSGVALGDYDGDGLCDIYLCNLDGTNALYRNLGNWQFKEVTQETGAACPNQTSTGAVFADINGDGHLDLLVTSMGGPNACFLNDGQGHFKNVTAAAGLLSRLGSTSMALADIDGNGTLDLYVANYGATSLLRNGGALNVSYIDGQPVVRGRYAQRIKIINGVMYELGEPDVLYLNDGRGNFTMLS